MVLCLFTNELARYKTPDHSTRLNQLSVKSAHFFCFIKPKKWTSNYSLSSLSLCSRQLVCRAVCDVNNGRASDFFFNVMFFQWLNNLAGTTVADEGCVLAECQKSCEQNIQPNAIGSCQGSVCSCFGPCDPQADMCGRTCMVSGQGSSGHCGTDGHCVCEK